MRFILSLSMIAALALLAGCQSDPKSSTETKNENPAGKEMKAAETVEKAESPKAADNDEAPRISLADAKKAFDAGEAVFIDTRSAVAYNNEHIKGALNVPAGEFETAYSKVPKDKKIIAYCS
jgi:predicted sulfurtransferase